MEDTERQKEDYKEFWKQAFFAALTGVITFCGKGYNEVSSGKAANYAAEVADESLKIYRSKRDSLREENLKAFT